MKERRRRESEENEERKELRGDSAEEGSPPRAMESTLLVTSQSVILSAEMGDRTPFVAA